MLRRIVYTAIMSDAYLDHLPSLDREKIRRRLRSPEEYERLREKVKGPEDLEREMERNAEFAEASLHLETDPEAQHMAQEKVRAALREHGIDASLDEPLTHSLESFRVIVTEKHGEPRLAVHVQPSEYDSVAPTGTVREILTLKPVLSQQIVSAFSTKKADKERQKKHPLH